MGSRRRARADRCGCVQGLRGANRMVCGSPKVYLQFDYLLIPSAQVFPSMPGCIRPKSVNGVAMDTYHRWMEVMVPATLLDCPVIGMPVGFNGAGLPIKNKSSERIMLRTLQSCRLLTHMSRRQVGCSEADAGAVARVASLMPPALTSHRPGSPVGRDRSLSLIAHLPRMSVVFWMGEVPRHCVRGLSWFWRGTLSCETASSVASITAENRGEVE